MEAMAEPDLAVVDTTLTMIAGRPMTAAGQIGCIMFHISGQDEDSQWFDFRPGYFMDITRVQWEKDTMGALLPTETAEVLVRNGYARFMTAAEADAHNAEVKGEANADSGVAGEKPPSSPLNPSSNVDSQASGAQAAERVESPHPTPRQTRKSKQEGEKP